MSEMKYEICKLMKQAAEYSTSIHDATEELQKLDLSNKFDEYFIKVIKEGAERIYHTSNDMNECLRYVPIAVQTDRSLILFLRQIISNLKSNLENLDRSTLQLAGVDILNGSKDTEMDPYLASVYHAKQEITDIVKRMNEMYEKLCNKGEI